MNLFIATKNLNKIKDYKNLIRNYDLDINLITENDLGIEIPEVEENGLTYKENAQIKARFTYKIVNMPVLADDSGMEVKALNGEPGIYSSRYESTDEKRVNKVLDKMKDINDRSARFICAICYISETGEETTVQGECKGQIALKASEVKGFGYTPIFQVSNGKTFSELDDESRNKINHRNDAFKQIVEKLK